MGISYLGWSPRRGGVDPEIREACPRIWPSRATAFVDPVGVGLWMGMNLENSTARTTRATQEEPMTHPCPQPNRNGVLSYAIELGRFRSQVLLTVNTLSGPRINSITTEQSSFKKTFF